MNASRQPPAPMPPLEPNQYRDWCPNCAAYTTWRWATVQRQITSCTTCEPQ